MEVTIHPKDFSNLLRCLALLNNNCNDADIQGGFLRQRSNDKTTIIYEMDLTPLVSDCNIVLINIKSKLSLLRPLSKQEVKIKSTDDKISFLGERPGYEFGLPRREFLDNKFITNEELSNIFSLREDDVVFEYTIDKDTSRLMKVISSQFNIVSFQILFDGETASIVGTTSSKNDHARIAQHIPIRLPWKGFSNIVREPFFIDCDGDIFFKMYRIHDDRCINKFRSSIGKITAILYCRSQLIEETVGEAS
jgi:hypothetical protein